ncbi:hypothetical protein ON010_g14947 [Phytophthora cinnamomi]|nr:hypothetical protein ON010_g14947 [Phytophthora cinnamomi]
MPDNASLKAKTHAGSDNAAQDRVGPDNAAHPKDATHVFKGRKGEKTDQGQDRPSKEDFTLQARAIRYPILRYATQVPGKYPTRPPTADATGLCEDDFADFCEGATPQTHPARVP